MGISYESVICRTIKNNSSFQENRLAPFLPEKELQVAITCDDVGNARHSHPLNSLKEFVAILDRYGVKGTFCDSE
jgi:hypothetical protein